MILAKAWIEGRLPTASLIQEEGKGAAKKKRRGEPCSPRLAVLLLQEWLILHFFDYLFQVLCLLSEVRNRLGGFGHDVGRVRSNGVDAFG